MEEEERVYVKWNTEFYDKYKILFGIRVFNVCKMERAKGDWGLKKELNLDGYSTDIKRTIMRLPKEQKDYHMQYIDMIVMSIPSSCLEVFIGLEKYPDYVYNW